MRLLRVRGRRAAGQRRDHGRAHARWDTHGAVDAKRLPGPAAWLRHEDYNIPEGAESLLRPYVESGSKFFVAKVDAQKVQFRSDDQGARRAQLSRLRVHYDSQEFALPVRLGLINARGPQDLLVHILARKVRYEVANYQNVAIPTGRGQSRSGPGLRRA